MCEKTGRWAVALRRALALPSGLCETRSWAACLRELQARPAALVALEVRPENVEATCQWLADLTRRAPRVRVIVMADRRLQQSEWLLREAGAIHVLFSPDQWYRLRPLLRSFIDQFPASPTTLRERVWSSLPWPRHAADVTEKSVITKGSENGQRPTD